ncbi:MAG: NAD(P)-binding domain-containing protein [Spirochaetes bacterium]|nr:NAD(P)-binding domain-containing protein [Spirochaetota bacterium]
MPYFKWLQKDAPTGEVERYPELSPDGETSLAGVFVAGDLSGMPLLKFAVHGGAEVVRRLFGGGEPSGAEDPKEAEKSGMDGTQGRPLDLFIAGSGPAGVSAALEAKRLGLRYLLVDSAQPFSTIAGFPRNKPIFLEPAGFQPEANLAVEGSTKESLLAGLKQQWDEQGLVLKQARVERISLEGKLVRIEVKSPDGKAESFFARKVILAIGKSGDSRRLGVPGEKLPHVFYRLIDAAAHRGQSVLVVGGGDSAVEAALALSEAGAKVALSYRKEELTRPKEGNAGKIAQAARAGHIELLMGSQVEAIGPNDATLHTRSEIVSVPAESVFILAGKELPLAFLKRSGIRMEGERGLRWGLGFLTLAFFFVMLYGVKASGVALGAVPYSAPWGQKIIAWLLSPGLILPSGVAAISKGYYLASWLGGILFLASGFSLIVLLLFRHRNLFRGAWPKVRYAYFALVALAFFFFQIQEHVVSPVLDYTRGTGYFYSLFYTITILVFGLRRMWVKPTRYIIAQTSSLIFIQSFFLFLLPYHFYSVLIAPHAGEAWVRQLFPSGSWSSFGFILFWPLNLGIFGASTFWTIFPFIQTFVILPTLVWRWGKGVYCSWICSCGAMAETLGDESRTRAPHGKTAKRWENLGQVVLWLAFVLLAWQFMRRGSGDQGAILSSVHHGLTLFYKIAVDTVFAGVIGMGAYFYFSGRIWCRYGCPLAALMHLYAKFTRFRIFSDKKRCISCNICTKVCHMGIDVMAFAAKGEPMNDVECVRCSACVVNCPTQVLSFGALKAGSRTEAARLEGGTRLERTTK